MGQRRSPDQVAAARHWQRFVQQNARIIAATGMPAGVIANVSRWDDFLTHGYVMDASGAFDVANLSRAQYAALVALAMSYFAAGYNFYTPIALRLDDQVLLRSHFGNTRG